MSQLPLLAIEITARREARGLSQAELAARLGIDTVTLHRYERGKLRPKQPRILAALRDVLEIPQVQLDALFRDWWLNAPEAGGPLRMRGADFLQAEGLDEYDLAERVLQIDANLLPSVQSSEIGTAEQWAPIFLAQPYAWRLMTRGSQIVGYWQYLVLPEETLDALLEGSLRDGELRADHLAEPDPLDPGARYTAYLPMLGVDVPYKTPAALTMLMRSLVSAFEEITREGLYFSRLGVVTFTPAGAQTARRLGFRCRGQRGGGAAGPTVWELRPERPDGAVHPAMRTIQQLYQAQGA